MSSVQNQAKEKTGQQAEKRVYAGRIGVAGLQLATEKVQPVSCRGQSAVAVVSMADSSLAQKHAIEEGV